MKYLKMLGLAVLSAMALTALAAGSASATTLEVNGVTQNKAVALEGTLKPGTSAILKTTTGSFVDTCTASSIKGSSESPFTGTTVGGKVAALTFSNCTHSTVVHSFGSVTVEHIKGTTNGTVRSSGVSVTVQSTTFGVNLNCTTSNTHMGTFTGSSSGHASAAINGVINCGPFVPSAKWEASYTLTTPTGLGFVA
jgi:hypothetical protein